MFNPYEAEQQFRMYKAIICYKNKSINKIGKDSIKEEFDYGNYIPTNVEKVIKEKVKRDYATINEALRLLNEYRELSYSELDDRILFDINKFRSIKGEK